jgi:hypothetical protein
MPVTNEEFQWIMQRVEETIRVRQQPLIQKINALQQQMRTVFGQVQAQREQNPSDITNFEVDLGGT